MNTTVIDNRLAPEVSDSILSWGAVAAGVVVALSIQIVLSSLGAGLGLAALNPLQPTDPAVSISYFAIFWWIATGLISLAIGAMVGGYLSDSDVEHEGEVVGLVVWSVTNLIGLLTILCTVGTALDRGGRLLGGGISTIVTSGAAASGPISERIKQFMPENMREINTGLSRSELDVLVKGDSRSDQGLTMAFEAVFNGQGVTSDPVNKEALINIVASRGNISREDAQATVNRWESSFNEAKLQFQKAKAEAELKFKQAADAAAKASSRAAFVVFMTLLLGLVTSALFGRFGIHASESSYRVRLF